MEKSYRISSTFTINPEDYSFPNEERILSRALFGAGRIRDARKILNDELSKILLAGKLSPMDNLYAIPSLKEETLIFKFTDYGIDCYLESTNEFVGQVFYLKDSMLLPMHEELIGKLSKNI